MASTAASMLSITSGGKLAIESAMLRITSGDRSTPGGKPPFIRACSDEESTTMVLDLGSAACPEIFNGCM